MPHSKMEDFLVLSTHNYLCRISKPSPELTAQIAKLKEASNRPQHAETRIQMEGPRVMWTVGGPSLSVDEEDDDSISSPMVCSSRRPTTNTRPREASCSLPEIQPLTAAPSSEDPHSQSLDARRGPKPMPSRISLLQRLSRILSSDELKADKKNNTTVSFESNEIFPDSPSSSSQFSLLKRIRSTITKGERSQPSPRNVLCSTYSSYPVAVVASIPHPQPTERKRRKDRKERGTPAKKSTDRIHTLVSGSGELQALEFKDDEVELTYGRILRLRRPRLASSLAGKERPGKRSYDVLESSFCSTDHYKSTHSLAIGPGAPADADDVLTAQRHTAAEYDPKMISEVEASLRTIMRGTAFVATTHNCLGEVEQRKILNERFRAKYPELRISYTKLRSIKREMADVAVATKVDTPTLAHALVYYERIVLQGRITKCNRKEIAAACFIIAVKICDPVGVETSFCFERLESTFRISHSDILSFELPVCLALSFELMPPRQQLQPHYEALQLSLMI
ncbi:hypothetical protein PRIPAC_86992 [Pristionchus pacificus]|uniref:Cyclin N-terminal domain-containing protein n=1 Tax=Pristionchus pacificus TaxID=54126 RepID=A0A2A6BUU8_PRIPA|nr:hypothetical protein PRIPAC_86992 [Pristionchus pacificus]|eukprot:PDM69596.1 hypothetical protein PRIPAC_44692 [Pristionchus pacificus]